MIIDNIFMLSLIQTPEPGPPHLDTAKKCGYAEYPRKIGFGKIINKENPRAPILQRNQV
jgi:hypothetical protein